MEEVACNPPSSLTNYAEPLYVGVTANPDVSNAKRGKSINT